MEILKFVGFGALGVLFVGWLAVSWMAPGRRRTVLEWLSACALYVALLCLFSSLIWRSWEGGNWIGVVAFGLLATIFAGGLGVTLVMTVREAAGRGGPGEASATH